MIGVFPFFISVLNLNGRLLSLNPEVQTDIVAMIGSSAALSISGIPFNGPIAGARVGYLDNQYILNPIIITDA
jgi:polyribonucleotide nucleotidyltransferase